VRRRGRAGPAVPVRLSRFNPADWPVVGVEDGWRLWQEARRAFVELYGDGSALGDVVELLVSARAERLRLARLVPPVNVETLRHRPTI
jgi:hypothetical protein